MSADCLGSCGLSSVSSVHCGYRPKGTTLAALTNLSFIYKPHKRSWMENTGELNLPVYIFILCFWVCVVISLLISYRLNFFC